MNLQKSEQENVKHKRNKIENGYKNTRYRLSTKITNLVLGDKEQVIEK